MTKSTLNISKTTLNVTTMIISLISIATVFLGFALNMLPLALVGAVCATITSLAYAPSERRN